MTKQLSDNSVHNDTLQSEIQMLTDSRNELMETADRVEEENRQCQVSYSENLTDLFNATASFDRFNKSLTLNICNIFPFYLYVCRLQHLFR